MMEHLSAGRLPLWISEKDRRGNRVRQDVIEAAYRIWNRALHFVRRQEGDVAPAAEIMECSAHCVSRAIRRGRKPTHIRDLDSYLYWAFVRKYNRRMIRERRIQYVESLELFVEGRLQPDYSWVSMLEDDILLKQLLGYLDPKIRIMVIRRLRRDSWAEIGQMFGISAHNAEVQYANAIKKARSRLFGKASEKGGPPKL